MSELFVVCFSIKGISKGEEKPKSKQPPHMKSKAPTVKNALVQQGCNQKQNSNKKNKLVRGQIKTQSRH